jgi:hypothetical protein
MKHSILAVGLATVLGLSACGKNLPPPAPAVAPVPVPGPASPPGADGARGEPGRTGSGTNEIVPAPQQPENK